jgi:TetR/AcrR family fatty acid metabolism transcriptional regulator
MLGEPVKWQGGDASEAPPRGEKYDRILEAAIEVIAQKGFERARVSDIASSAGIADGTVYLYFKNKNVILRAAIDSAFAHFSDRVSASLASAGGPIEQLTVIARLHLETLTAKRNLAIIIQNELRQNHQFLEEFTHQPFVNYINLIRETIRRGQAEGAIRSELSDRVAALCLFGALDEIISSWLYTGKPIDTEHAAAQVLDVLLHGMSTRADHAEP